MKKQFIIKAAQSVKDVANAATKLESTKFLKLEFAAEDPVCCRWLPEIVGLSKPVFSL